jgi:hypothetical protein
MLSIHSGHVVHSFRACCPFIPGMLSIHSGHVVHRSGHTQKVDNMRAESADNFERNGWTSWNGIGGQLRAEQPDNMDRSTHRRPSE